jgi:hypothetical protein
MFSGLATTPEVIYAIMNKISVPPDTAAFA